MYFKIKQMKNTFVPHFIKIVLEKLR